MVVRIKGWQTILAAAVVVVLAPGVVCAAATPAPATPAPMSAPATAPAPGVAAGAQASTLPAAQTTFENGDPINALFTAMALRFQVMVIEPAPVKAFVLKDFELPAKLDDAMTLLQQTLEAQGYAVVKSGGDYGIVLRIVTAKEAKVIQQQESPVTFGREPEKVDTKVPGRLVTHIMPINHPEMIAMLKRNATSDKDVAVEEMGSAVTGFNLMIMGPAAKVQKVVDNLGKLDADDKPNLVAKTMALKRLNATETAERLNADFARDGSGLKATAEPRTNALIITGPEDAVTKAIVDVMTMEMSRGPGEEPALPLLERVPVPEGRRGAPGRGGAVGPGAQGRSGLDGKAEAGENKGFHNGTGRVVVRLWATSKENKALN